MNNKKRKMDRQKFIRTIPLILMLLMMGSPAAKLIAQQPTSAQVQEAQQQLQTMTPDQIDAKLKEMGITRDQAEQKAKEYGIDLNTYLNKSNSAASPDTAGSLLQSGPSGTNNSVQNGNTVSTNRTASFVDTTLFDKGLPYFGYDVFKTTPAAFEPSASGPVDADYIIGPQDVLRVSVWGQVEQQNEATVDKDGRIFIPTAGPIVVSGLTIDQVNKVLTKQLSRSFQGLASHPPTVWLDVTLSKIRPKKIFIVGEVNNPGGYTVSSYSNIFNSLFAVGGPTVNGSLREVRLIRDNKVIARVDLYAYLTGADKNNDLRVQNNDIIYVPVRKNSVYIYGQVRHPGIYELLPGENLKKLIEYAGGSLPSAYVERIQIKRIVPYNERVKNDFDRRLLNINFRELLSKNADYTLLDGDMITVGSILDDMKNFVTITGAVKKPGTYQLSSGMKLRDLIELADSLREEVYMIRGELTRTLDDNVTKVSIPFDLHRVIENEDSANILLMPQDEVMIHDISISQLTNKFVYIHGSVKNPGKYELTNNMTLIDVLMLAGGYTEDASIVQAEVSRMDKSKSGDTLVYLYFPNLPDLNDTSAINSFVYFENARKHDLSLQHRDHIFIRPNPNFHHQQIVKISGEVKYPGEYSLRTYNEYLSELISRAGGKTAAGYLRGGILTRQGQRVNVDFENVFNKSKGEEDIVLHPEDSIYIPKKPNAVKMAGQVNNPGLLGFIDGDDLWNYIDRAGGLTDSSQYILLISPNGNVEKFGTGWFHGNPKVYDGSTVVVTKIPPPPPNEPGVDIGGVIKDVFAITASALTILVLSKGL
jgi:polysaccharide biosynthesis/export protein